MSKCFTNYSVMYRSNRSKTQKWFHWYYSDVDLTQARGGEVDEYYDVEDAVPAIMDNIEDALLLQAWVQNKSDTHGWDHTYKVFRTTYREAPVI